MVDRVGHGLFTVGKDQNSRKLQMKFKYFADYMTCNRDDDPLYLFETLPLRDPLPLLNDFDTTDLFPHDWLNLVNPAAKPPFRWLTVGPKRSGTKIHTDPLGTSAWNAVTHGRKHWVLFEPGTPEHMVKGKDLIFAGEESEAIIF